MSNDVQARLGDLAQLEATLTFQHFGVEDAIAIGMKLYEKAKAEGQNIAIHISINRKDLFHLSMDGCSPDNDAWLRRKENMVYRLGQSSMRTVTFCEMMGASVFDFYAFDHENYVAAGGGFPINIAGVGCVGAIAVGGMMPHQDHQYIVDVLKEYLKQ